MPAFYESPAFGGSGDYTRSDGIRVVRADRQPCPVCGHPTGDCTGELSAPKTIFGFNTNSTLDDNVTFYMDEDYYETREIAPGLSTRRLVHKKGSSIPLSKAKELGLI